MLHRAVAAEKKTSSQGASAAWPLRDSRKGSLVPVHIGCIVSRQQFRQTVPPRFAQPGQLSVALEALWGAVPLSCFCDQNDSSREEYFPYPWLIWC